jgi:large subunit ribosomal protein L28
MARVCVFTGKRPNVAHKVSHSNIKTKKRQIPNLHSRRLWWDEGQRFVRVRLSTEALRTIAKKGLHAYALEMGVDLNRY